MINKIFSVGLLCLMFSTQAWSANHLMVIGAGESDVISSETIKNLDGYIKQSPGMKVDIALSGAPSTEALIQKSFPTAASKSHFLKSDYDRLIKEYTRKLENNEMGEGDQFMI